MSIFEPKDVKGQPVSGRMFPVPFSAVVHECKLRQIMHHTGDRIQIAMRNLNRKGLREDDWLLAELRPKEELTVYSVPQDFDVGIATQKTLEAIAAFARLNSLPVKPMHSCIQCYQAYLKNQSDLSLCHAFWHFRQPKYRGNQKFSNAFNKQPVRTDFRSLTLTDSGIEYKGASNQSMEGTK